MMIQVMEDLMETDINSVSEKISSDEQNSFESLNYLPQKLFCIKFYKSLLQTQSRDTLINFHFALIFLYFISKSLFVKVLNSIKFLN